MVMTAVQTNAQPPGGMAATQPITPAGNMTPADIQAIVESLTPIQARFRQASTFVRVALDQANFGTQLGVQKPVQVRNVGLAVRTVTEWNIVLSIQNTNAGAQTMNVSPWFPYNLIANTQIQVNGGATVYSAGGIATLCAMTRTRRGSRRIQTLGTVAGVSAVTGPFGPALDLALLSTQLSANLTSTTVVAPSPTTYGTLSGLGLVTEAATSTSTITLRFITVEKLAQDRDSLLGALPLQNNATFIQIQRQNVGSLAPAVRNDFSIPFFPANANFVNTVTSWTADTMYEFCSVPDDPSLYQAMITNSFQVQEQTAQTTAVTGTAAFKYNIPQNLFLLAAHLLTTDSTGTALPGYNGTTGFGNLSLQYNGGSVIPVIQFPFRERAIQYLDYDWDPQIIQGYRFWDGEDTADDITASDNMGWLDTYSVASPQIVVDVGASASPTLTTNIVREAVVAGAVQQIGG